MAIAYIDSYRNMNFLPTKNTTLKLHDPQKFQFKKKHFTAKITLILMIKRMPLTFLDDIVMTYFMFVLLRPRSNFREQFQRKEGRSIDFHAILKSKPLDSA